MGVDVIDLVLAGLTVASFFIGRLSASRAQGKNDGVMLTEIGYIKGGIDDLKGKVDANSKNWQKLESRVSVLEEAMRMYHNH